MKKYLLIILLGFMIPEIINAQCTNQVMHIAGTMNINGVDVTATSTGTVDVNSVYCVNTFPYFIGYSYSTSSSGNGSYTFNFSPPINALTLNFSGTSNVGSDIEEVRLIVNGSHYAIPSVGTSNGCDPMAVLTPAGDIAGCSGCGVSGWSGTTITGPILTLTVDDTVISGIPNGTIFSLFICTDIKTDIANLLNEIHETVYPSPFTTQLDITLSGNEKSQFILYDNAARKLLQQTFTSSVSINTTQLERGIYFYEVRSGNKMVRNGKVVKE